MTGVFPGARCDRNELRDPLKKMAVLREFRSLEVWFARRAPGAWKVIHRLSTKMAKLREFGSFCDNLPQIEVLEPSFVQPGHLVHGFLA
jgi:hypothetical protein